MFLLVALLSVPAGAQWYVGGSLSGDYTEKGTIYKSWSYEIAPEAGRVIKENIAVGLRISYGKSYSYSETKKTSQDETIISKKTDNEKILFSIMPYFAYRPFMSGKFSLWAETEAFLVPKQEGADWTIIGMAIAPVLTYNLCPNILVRTKLNFATFHISGDFSNGFSIGAGIRGKEVISLPDLSIGAIYVF